MRFGEDLQAHQMGLVDEEQGDLLLGCDVAEGVADDFLKKLDNPQKYDVIDWSIRPKWFFSRKHKLSLYFG